MTDADAGIRRLARIDLAALAGHLEAAVAAGADLLDARADAYGHGLALVAPVARRAGVQRIAVSDERDAAVAAAAGWAATAVLVGRLTPPVPAAEVIGAEAWGLDGSGAPVLTLVGEVIAVKHVGADAGVSYGYTYRTAAPTVLALIGLGYADGVPRLASNRVAVAVAGGPHPLVGRVAMDQFVVDCGDALPEPGAEAVLFGRGAVPATAWAAATGRGALALTAGLGRRIRRVSA